MQVRQKLTETESTIAFVAGGGLVLIMLAFGLAAARGTDANISALNVMLLIGVILLLAGLAGWVIFTSSWRKSDKWDEPLYTGHEGEHHEEHAAEYPSSEDAEAGLTSHVEMPHHHQLEAAHTHHAASVNQPAVTSTTAPAPMSTAMPAAPAPKAEVAPAPKPVEAMKAEAAPAPHAVETPKAESASAKPTPAKAEGDTEDELTQIEGIGPKISGALKAAGIRTFKALSERKPEELEHIVRSAGVRMVGHGESWPQQAKLAAEGKWEELQTLQDSLQVGHHADSKDEH